MKVLLINGSPNENGCTAAAVNRMARILRDRDIAAEVFWIGGRVKGGCMGCGGCAQSGRCVMDDCVNEALEKAKDADGFVFATPVHFASPSGDMVAFMDRFFYAGCADFRFKPAAVLAVARRGGCSSSIDVMMKYPTYNQMPVVSADYWPMAYAHKDPAQLREDEEGMFTIDSLARNMAWMLKCVDAGKKAGIEPEYEEKTVWTNFVR